MDNRTAPIRLGAVMKDLENRLLERTTKIGGYIAKSNPYSVLKSGTGAKVVNTETGHVKGTFKSRKKALKQFNLLEGIEHGWKPTRK